MYYILKKKPSILRTPLQSIVFEFGSEHHDEGKPWKWRWRLHLLHVMPPMITGDDPHHPAEDTRQELQEHMIWATS